MRVQQMKKEDFVDIPNRESWDSEVSGFNSMVIIPREDEELHDSGYMCMEFIAVDDNDELICKLASYSDVIHINGIGGYGDWKAIYGVPKTLPPIGWSIDCLPCGYLRLFASHNSLKAGHALSDFEIFSIKNN